MNETIYNDKELLDMLDSFLREPTEFWNDFYVDREKKIPFFKNVPDENLVSYFENGTLSPGKVLELGCGPGRNAIYLAKSGCEVDAVDLSETSLQWAKERAEELNLPINFIHKNIFELNLGEGVYDFVYDSGCFHHIAPHRRMGYKRLIEKSLKPGGYFAVTCFAQGGKFGGADISDWEVYRRGTLLGGLGYTDEKLKNIFSEFNPVIVRKMKDVGESETLFGLPDLWTGLFQKS